MSHIVKILSIAHLTHDVLKIVTAKPDTLSFKPGQAVDLSINKKGWVEELRPFTFTSLPDNEYVEFTIKTYPAHKGVTGELLLLTAGDELILHDVWGDILYKEEGVFIAGGAGITPFISIFKELEKENKIGNNRLIFANKEKADIILEDKFEKMLGKNFINVLSDENIEGYEQGRITPGIIKKHIISDTDYFYLCGPEQMMTAMEEQLGSLGIEKNFIVKENF